MEKITVKTSKREIDGSSLSQWFKLPTLINPEALKLNLGCLNSFLLLLLSRDYLKNVINKFKSVKACWNSVSVQSLFKIGEVLRAHLWCDHTQKKCPNSWTSYLFWSILKLWQNKIFKCWLVSQNVGVVYKVKLINRALLLSVVMENGSWLKKTKTKKQDLRSKRMKCFSVEGRSLCKRCDTLWIGQKFITRPHRDKQVK